MCDDDLSQVHPPFGLTVTAGDITLRVFRDSDIPAYAELNAAPLFADESAPYAFAWAKEPSAIRLRKGVEFQWSARTGVTPENWRLPLLVFEDERLIGSQDISASNFTALRVVKSGSYLRLDAQGRGLGTLMRQMMLVLAFDHLGAVRAESVAVTSNERSMAVSRHCGYRHDGTMVALNGDRRVEMQRVLVTPETFIRPEVDVVVRGLTGELREQLGVISSSL